MLYDTLQQLQQSQAQLLSFQSTLLSSGLIGKTVTGQGALDLVHARLMLEARRLLAYTPMPVTEIAHALGYEDPAYFSKFFARSVGEPPSAYRESVAKGVRLMDKLGSDSN